MDANTGHLIISLLLAVVAFLVRVSSVSMEKRITALESLLDEFQKALENAKVDDSQ